MADAAVASAPLDAKVQEAPRSTPIVDTPAALKEVGNTKENATQNSSILRTIKDDVSAAYSGVLHAVDLVDSAVSKIWPSKDQLTPGLAEHTPNLEQRPDGSILQRKGEGTTIETLRDKKTNETTTTRKDLKGNTDSETTDAGGKVLGRTSFHLNDDQSRTYRTEDLRSGNPVVDTIQMDANTQIKSHSTDVYDQQGKHTTVKDGDGNVVYKRETTDDGFYYDTTYNPKTGMGVAGQGHDAAPVAPTQDRQVTGQSTEPVGNSADLGPVVMPRLETNSNGWTQTKPDGTTITRKQDDVTGEATVTTDKHNGHVETVTSDRFGTVVRESVSDFDSQDKSTRTTMTDWRVGLSNTKRDIDVKNVDGVETYHRSDLWNSDGQSTNIWDYQNKTHVVRRTRNDGKYGQEMTDGKTGKSDIETGYAYPDSRPVP